jgi:predicted amidohydrolase YtcJ
MLKYIAFSISILTLTACMKAKSADLVIHNARIHTMDNSDQVAEAMAIKDGKILEVGPERQILNKYSSEETIDAGGKDVYPGFTDAHGHLGSYSKMLLSANLFGSKSYDEMLVITEKYADKSSRKFITGYGWDHASWGDTILPNNERLNEVFPDVPVCLYRVDGHTLLANDAALKLAKITPESTFYGGMVKVENGKCTGILVDNAMEAMNKVIPPFSQNERIEKILEIQDELLQYGVTSVHEAGIANEEIALYKKMVDEDKLKIEVYAMLMDSPENRKFVEKNGKVNWGTFYISSFKMYADGALGSRGALLKAPYSDEHNHLGVQTTRTEDMLNLAEFCLKHDYQLNTHAIGDSTNKVLLTLYEKAFKAKKDHRWRIEHAQIVDPIDFELFAKYAVFPSVQPTHAVSDQRWAEKRLGKNRMAGAYAYQSILNQTGIFCLGTDFPVERINPFLTIHAATNRKNADNFPDGGFLAKEAITLKDCLKGMTIWAAFAAFRENEAGSLEKGKEATFVILDRPLNQGPNFIENFANRTVIRGETVYSVD